MKGIRIVIASVVVLIALALIGLWWKGVFGPKVQEPTKVQKKGEIKPIITSEDLIAKALAAKEIDYETSLLYRTYAVFSDPRLPEKYRSDVIDLDAATLIFTEVEAKRDQLSPSVLKELAPFMARPNDPISIFNRPPFAAAGIVPAFGADNDWSSETALDGRVRIWTRRDSRNASLTYAGRVEGIWPLLKGLINEPLKDKEGDPSPQINPDEAIDIYVLPLGGMNPRKQECLRDRAASGCTVIGASGWAIRCDPRVLMTSSGYIIIDSSLRGSSLDGTIAHELFHVSQFSYDRLEDSWLMEATATWAEFRVVQMLGGDLSDVHKTLPYFFNVLDQPLDREGESITAYAGVRMRQYGSYLFFLFAQMERNDSIVRQIWESARTKDGVKAVDAVFSLKDNFREFALRNWNFEPVNPSYSKPDPEFPDLGPSLTKDIKLSKDKKETIDKPIERLAARYYNVSVPVGEGINKITVTLDDVTSRPGAGVDAIVTIEGRSAEVRHWSSESKVTFCMDTADERLLQMVLIVSNGSETTLTGKIEIDPSSKACNEWSGTITFTRNVDGKHSEGNHTQKLAFKEQVRMFVDFEKNKETAFDYEMKSIYGSYNLTEYRYSSTFEGCVTDQADFGGSGLVEKVPDAGYTSHVPGKAFAHVSLAVDAEDTYQIYLDIHLLPPTGGMVIFRDIDYENDKPVCRERERHPVPQYWLEGLEGRVRAHDYRGMMSGAFIITGKASKDGIFGSRTYRGDGVEGTYGSENFKSAAGIDTGLSHLGILSTVTVTYELNRKKKDKN
jgi:hypothetical protein